MRFYRVTLTGQGPQVLQCALRCAPKQTQTYGASVVAVGLPGDLVGCARWHLLILGRFRDDVESISGICSEDGGRKGQHGGSDGETHDEL